MFNPTGCSQVVKAGAELGRAAEAKLIKIPSTNQSISQLVIRCITEAKAQVRKQKLREMVGQPELFTLDQTEKLHQFLEEHHDTFSLDPNKRGETDLLTMTLDTGNAPPNKQSLYRIPFAMRAEVAK